MFLALDECIGKEFVTIGCLCLPQEKLSGIEKGFVDTRLKQRCWGEIKWSKITETYLEKYQELTDIFLLQPEVTYHSWTYKKPNAVARARYYGIGTSQDDVIFRQAYLLIRSVIRKCKNNGYRGSFYIVSDDSGSGPKEYKKTNELLQGDSNISGSTEIEFCSTGNSAVIGGLQVVDLCTGAVTSSYEKELRNQPNQKFVEFLVKRNSKVPLNFSPPKLPKLHDHKLHHCFFVKK